MGYVYALLFDDLAIKVGQAVDPLKRIGTHRSDSARYGRVVVQIWSAATDDMNGTEGRLIDYCLSRGTVRPGTREYFTGVPWDSSKWDSIAADGTASVPQVGQADGTASVPPVGQAWDTWTNVPVSQESGIRRVILDGVTAGTETTSGLLHLAKTAGFTSESWFFEVLKELQADGLIKRGVRRGMYETVNGE